MDIIEILTESPRPRKYWNALKTKLNIEGSKLSHEAGQLKMQSSDGKFYETDVLETENVLRLIQSIPSPKADPSNSGSPKWDTKESKKQKTPNWPLIEP